MTSRLVEERIFDGFKVSAKANGVVVSHLQFADDSIFFVGATRENGSALSNLLTWFDVMLGLRINLAMSKLYQVGEVPMIEELAGILGYKVESLPTMYLDLSLGARSLSVSVWEKVLERIAFIN